MNATLKELESLALYMQKLTTDENDKKFINEKFKIDKNHLGYALLSENEKYGGATFLINGRHTKNNLYNLMHAYLKGFASGIVYPKEKA